MPSSATSTNRPAPSGPAAPRRTWPVTAAAVLLGWCLIAWVVFAAALNTAPFFGEQPTREEDIESGLVLATAVVPLLLLAAVAVRWGSRWGILLLVGPALLLVPLGLDWVSDAGNGNDPARNRSVTWADLGGELVRPNWVVATGLLLVLAVSVGRSRRARRADVRRTVPGEEHDGT
ncbi:hypothetical protein GCM10009867_15580 [Pedococcus aerophilus]|uniref:Uncharacterized protein n=1 Tax=Pedococcus aerophilus TaxID=436356 RepID=A0ABN3UKV5_9MICO